MRISFVHAGDASWASYRYRASRPAAALGASLNDLTADVLVFCKPVEALVQMAMTLKASGRTIIVDICDAHRDRPTYPALTAIANAVTCATPMMAAWLRSQQPCAQITVIPDAYEFEECPPHAAGRRLLWFGHQANYPCLERVLPTLTGMTLDVVTNRPGATPWSLPNLRAAFARADLVILPMSDPRKSANRAIEAIRQGCGVVAEPHPALEHIPGVWLGNIAEGIHARTPRQVNADTARAQDWIRPRFSMEACAAKWRDVCLGVPA